MPALFCNLTWDLEKLLERIGRYRSGNENGGHNGNRGREEAKVKWKAKSVLLLYPARIIFSPFFTNAQRSEASLPPFLLTLS